MITAAVLLRQAFGEDFLLRARQDGQAAVGVFAHWDGAWLSKIAESGYPALAHFTNPAASGGYYDAVVFPPLLPGLAAGMHALLGIDVRTAALIWVTLALPVALIGLYRLVEDEFGGGVASLTVVLLLVFPSAFFLGVVYEDVFVLGGVVWAFLLARHGRPMLAGVAMAVAMASKVVSAVVIVPILLEMWQRRSGSWRRPDLGSLRLLIAPALFLAGWCGYQWRALGSPLLFLSEEARWGRRLSPPWVGIYNGWQNMLGAGHLTQSGPVYLLDLVAILLLIAAAVYLWRRGCWAYAVTCALLLLAFTSSRTADSVDRYTLTAFPLFIAGALALEGRRWLERLVIVFGVVVQYDLISRYAVGHWAG